MANVEGITGITVKNVSKFFTRDHCSVQAIGDISFSVRRGEFVAILGPSGCGKSTLLKMIAGLESCDQGDIVVKEDDLIQPERHRMMMFQEAALFPWCSVIENVMYGLRFKKGLNRSEYRDVALYYLDLVGLKTYADARVYQLSGGMKQRVALARVLAPNPEILLMDEPFSALDSLTCEQLYKDIQYIWKKKNKTVVLVTHNVREAIVLAQRIIILSASPGHVIQEINVDFTYPRSVYDVEVSEMFDKIVSNFHNYSA